MDPPIQEMRRVALSNIGNREVTNVGPPGPALKGGPGPEPLERAHQEASQGLVLHRRALADKDSRQAGDGLRSESHSMATLSDFDRSEEVLAPQRPAGIVCADEEEDNQNPQMVTGYVDDVYAYLHKLEDAQPVRADYMSNFEVASRQRVNPRMRAILVDWLIQVHRKFKLLQETLYQTVAILDLYLQVKEVPKEQLQLVGVTSMLVASKYEEMYCPEVADFVYITDKAYTSTQINAMERSILHTLAFRLGRPIPLHFLRRFSKALGADATMHTLAKYLMEMTLTEYAMCHVKPSLVAAGALRLSQLLLDGEDTAEESCSWGRTIQWYSRYEERDLRPVVHKMASLIKKREESRYQAVHSKYKSAKFLHVGDSLELDQPLVDRLMISGGAPLTPNAATGQHS